MAEPPSKTPEPGEAFAAGVSLFDDTEDAATIVDPSALFEAHQLPDYPAVGNIGRFELLGRIAVGGMAEIFLAREKGMLGITRHVVLKRVLPHVSDDEDFVKMFAQEAQIATRLYHPNVCHMYEFGNVGGAYFMAMEWVHGVPLRRLIRRARELGGIPLPLSVKIIAHLAEALHYVHHAADAQGVPLDIVHRDVSPHNVMVSYKGLVKLLDFGIAKARGQKDDTEAGVVKGKYAYMSPEQCQGLPTDKGSDIFALGVCLYETVTGQPLYHRATVLNTMAAIVEEDVPSARTVMPDLPYELDVIIRRALAKRPDDRYATSRDMQEDLDRFLNARGELVDPPRIAAFLDRIFTEEERAPLASSARKATGSYQALTPSAAMAAQSGSFGPFGQGQRVDPMASHDELEIPIQFEHHNLETQALPPVRLKKRKPSVLPAVLVGVATVGMIVIALVLAWLILSGRIAI